MARVNSTLKEFVSASVTTALLSFQADLAALELGVGDWQAHGFASQGYTLSSEYNFFGQSRNTGSLDFTEVGVNISGHVMPNLLIAAQGLYRNAGGADNEELRLDYAHFDYNLNFEDLKAGIRLGRVKVPFGLYNETRDVVWTRPGVFVPQSIYFDSLALRQPMIAADGGVLYGRYAFGNHALTSELLIADPQDGSGGATEFLTGIPNVRGNMEGRPLITGRVGYEWLEGRFKLLLSVVDLNREFKSDTPGVSSGKVSALYPLVSMQINLEDWTLTSEYGRVTTERAMFTAGRGPTETTSESFYVQAQYRISQNWSALLRYDDFAANVNDRDGERAAALTGLPKHRFFSRDLTAGFRWEFIQNWMLAGEYHSIWGSGWVTPQDNPELDTGRGRERWDLFAIMLSYRF